jgi:hypothetical protein
MVSRARCADFVPVILTQTQAGKFDCILAISKTKALVEKMSFQISVLFAQRAIRGQKTSPAKSQPQFGYLAKSGELVKMSKKRFLRGCVPSLPSLRANRNLTVRPNG